ncbi:MAG: PhzF family phenazine biosynthesis protein, partial [Planctomycetota bacterium]
RPGADPNQYDFQIRWLTPTVEVDLCGHATLAAAHALWTEPLYHDQPFEGDVLKLWSPRSGHLPVTRDNGRYVLDFPLLAGEPIEPSGELVAALGGLRPITAREGQDILAVFENKRDVLELRPDMGALAAIETRCVVATAPATSHDYVCRVFGPRVGVNEDHATGSAQCLAAPYWAEQLGKTHLTAHQVSPRGAVFDLNLAEGSDRIRIGGSARTYLRGSVEIR